ncbi:competence protein CoiA family protein [Streptomyces lydicus]|uniref:competence protein CoiA family protein n=1 Tax=Streptomyces lydicus TaxID=47763 RepID=UPI00379FF32B
MHPEHGRIDATAEDLGCNWSWSAVHRVRPRAPLACPECDHGLRAKVSRRGLRFFAHDPGSPSCGLAGESMEHRLLKLELVLAARDAGWHAELEVPAISGRWRADVLATAPDRSWRMAWEAQLSPITTDAIRQRTERFAADGVAVCWVATRRHPWLGEVPSVRTRPPSDEPGSQWQVTEGLARFAVEACDDERVCPGDGHGIWSEVQASLREFVAWSLSQRIVPYRLSRQAYLAGHPWAQVWTASQYAAAAEEFSRAAERDQWRSSPRGTVRVIFPQRGDAGNFARQAARLLTGTQPVTHRPPARRAPKPAGRRRTPAVPIPETGPDEGRPHLHDAVSVWVQAKTGSTPQIRHGSHLAGGSPVYLGGKPYGVLCPDPEQMDWRRWPGLKDLVVFTTTCDERNRIAATAPNGVLIVVLGQSGGT